MGATREANHPNPRFYPDDSPQLRVAGVPTGSPWRHCGPQNNEHLTRKPPLPRRWLRRARDVPATKDAARANAETGPHRRAVCRTCRPLAGCGVTVANRWRHAAHASDGHSRAQARDIGLGMGATREANHPNPRSYPDDSPQLRVAGVPTGSPRRHRGPRTSSTCTKAAFPLASLRRARDLSARMRPRVRKMSARPSRRCVHSAGFISESSVGISSDTVGWIGTARCSTS